MPEPSNDMPMSEKLKSAKDILRSLSELIRFADQKALVLLAVMGFLAGNLVPKLADIYKPPHCWGKIALATLAALSTCIALFFCLKVVYPRLQRSFKSAGTKGFVYWAHVLNFPTFPEFHEAFKGLTADALLEELVSEIYHVSHINHTKYYTLQNSFIMAGVSAILTLAVFFVC